MTPFSIPEFRPSLAFRTGHLQTLGALWWPHGEMAGCVPQRLVELPDGDRIVLHDDCPAGWHAGGRVALLIHGMAGCHSSPYMRRIARKLNGRGVRVFRMDLRGSGAGMGLARGSYHSGRSEDAAAALREIGRQCPQALLAVVGFSLGGNITLKMLGEGKEELPANLDRAAAVCPPTDLLACVTALSQGVNRWYDRYFARLLVEQVAVRRRLVPDLHATDFNATPRGVWEFDAAFTAPVGGFGTAENYYRTCSSAQFIPNIRLPTLILAAADDPLVPPEGLESVPVPSAVTRHIAPSGGHLGFIGRRNGDPDRRWMDWRVVEWVTRG